MHLYRLGAAPDSSSLAQELVTNSEGHFVLASKPIDGSIQIRKFTDEASLADEYGRLADEAHRWAYLGMYSITRPEWPKATNELGTELKIIPVRAEVPERVIESPPVQLPPVTVTTSRERVGLGWILGGLVLGLMGLSAARKRRS